VGGAFAERFAERVAQWPGTMRVLRSKEAQLAFGAIRPDLLAALAAAPEPERALTRWETLLSRLPSAVNLFRLFEQRPGLLEQVLRVLTLAPPLADALARRVDLLDALIDHSALALPGPVEELAARMTRPEDADLEARLDRIRQVVGEERFMLGVQLVEARHDPLAIAAGLSRVAEAALGASATAAITEFAATHGVIEGGELVILGLGRLGGGALTHASDLDLVYLFTGEIGRESDGRRPLTASLYFNRLAARVTSALSVPTAEGALYEVDTRLRPQGHQGPLAVSLDSFARYQAEDAWTWEHMALTRARPLFGSPEARAALASTMRAVLGRPRDPDELRDAVLAMRAEMAAHKIPAGPLDAKLLRGGLVDCEFIVHYLQLRAGVALEPALEGAMSQLVGLGLLPADYAAHHAILTRLLVAARLLAPDGQLPPEPAASALARACGEPDSASLLRTLSHARQGIARCWTELFGQDLEIDA
jgi:glutamate-ammonia-ligase adenylyltransferase